MALVKLNNRGVRSATTFGSISGLGEMRFIKKQTASSSATISFVDGTSDVVLDNTYKEYLFTFKNIHPATDNAEFQFNLSVDSGSNYNVTKTSTYFYAFQYESGSSTSLTYNTSGDLAQSTAFQDIAVNVGSDNDQCTSGYLHLFNPSSTTFVKHWISKMSNAHGADIMINPHTAGYGNTTSAVDAIQFKMSTGNIDAGDICLYGIN
jgi:hypothetical protein